MSNRVVKVLDQVKKRKQRIAKTSFEEKLCSQFSPYTTAKGIPRLEEHLFNKNSSSAVFSLSSLRDRYCLLYTVNGILRGESLFKSELSDLCDLIHKDQSTGQEILIHVMRIAMGKTNGLRVLYGRCIRHKDVNQCAIGALGLYLLGRSMLTSEFQRIDFSQNEQWFNIKLLVDSRGENNATSISDQAYYSSMKQACDALQIPSKHFIHFGRSAGSVKAELDELDGYHINDIGNWNVDTRRDVYSAKLPMKAMRVMGGHPEYKGSVYLPRANLDPPLTLQNNIPFHRRSHV